MTEQTTRTGADLIGVECYLWCDPPRSHGTKEEPMRGWVTGYKVHKSDPSLIYTAGGVEGTNFTHAYPVYLGSPEDAEELPEREEADGGLEMGESVEVIDPDEGRYGEIGVISELDRDGTPEVLFDKEGEDDYEWINVESLRRLRFIKDEAPKPKKDEPKSETATEFKLGDKIRVKASVKDPHHGWGNVKPGDVGTVTEVGCDGRLEVDFPSHSGWTALASEMELDEAATTKTPESVFEVGDEVTIHWPGDASDGRKGTVVVPQRSSTERYVGVRVEGFGPEAYGHNLDDKITTKDGWWILPERLTKTTNPNPTTTTTEEKKETTTMSKTLSEQQETIAVAQIRHHGEQLTLPEGMSMDEAIKLLERRKKYLEEEVQIIESFDVFPWDGAAGFDTVLTRKFGWAAAEATPGFFGKNPPQMIGVEVAPGRIRQVPWGRFSIPGVDGTVDTGMMKKDKRAVFAVKATVKRKDEVTIKSLCSELREYLKDNSIYRGKAIKIRFRNEDGDALPMPEPKFLETEDIDERMLVYPEATEAAIETNLFTPIRRVQDCLDNGIPIKRGVLLGGTYGTGKTLAAKVASKYAVENGVTYIYIPRADELADAIEFAKQYQSPASVIFCEDIDRVMNGERSVEMDDILNIIDGIDTKSSHILVVLTTNNLKGINPAMMRPGRLDAVIEVLPPDAVAVEKLLRIYGGTAISPDVDLHPAAEKLAGKIPAVIAEVVKRAKLAQLRRTPSGQAVTSITGESLLESAETMSAQLKLLAENSKVEEPLPTLDLALQSMVKIAAEKAVENIETKVRALHQHICE